MDPSTWQEKDISTYHLIDQSLRELPLGFGLKSGLQCSFYGVNDWVIFNEIFLHQEYDLPIESIFSRTPDHNKPFYILDLGANSGLFTLRVLDLCLKRNLSPENIKVQSVEGNPKTYKHLIRRIKENHEAIGSCVQVNCGLVGQKEGKAEITDYPLSCYNSLNPLTGGMFSSSANRIKVPYLNLDKLVEVDSIDLIKCDIEGCEQQFLENYPHLLEKTNHLVIELHNNYCDISECQTRIKKSGLVLQKSLRDDAIETSHLAVEFYSRE